MDRWLVVLFLILVTTLTGCGAEKTASSVFPDADSSKSGTQPSCLTENRIENQFVVKWEDGRTTVEKERSAEAFIESFVEPKLSAIKYVEYDQAISLQQTEKVSTSSETSDWGQAQIEISEVWEKGIDGAGVTVAVIDSGVDTWHKDLSDKMAFNEGETPGNGIDDDNNGLIDDHVGYDFYSGSGEVQDPIGHGTHVAGIIAGGLPGSELRGVAYKARILPISFMAPDGTGALSAAIQAIEYAVSRKVDVINASWGGSGCSKLLGEAIKSAGDQGILFVAAAGNRGINLDYLPEYPAAFNLPAQITVGSVNSMNITSGFSNYSYTLAHIMAPGQAIFSSYPGNSYEFLNGTSMAAPFVAGLAAVLKSAHPSATPLQLKRAIVEGSEKGPYAVSGRGRIHAPSALLKLSQILKD